MYSDHDFGLFVVCWYVSFVVVLCLSVVYVYASLDVRPVLTLSLCKEIQLRVSYLGAIAYVHFKMPFAAGPPSAVCTRVKK